MIKELTLLLSDFSKWLKTIFLSKRKYLSKMRQICVTIETNKSQVGENNTAWREGLSVAKQDSSWKATCQNFHIISHFQRGWWWLWWCWRWWRQSWRSLWWMWQWMRFGVIRASHSLRPVLHRSHHHTTVHIWCSALENSSQSTLLVFDLWQLSRRKPISAMLRIGSGNPKMAKIKVWNIFKK